MPAQIVSVGYFNNSGLVVPAHGVVQFSGGAVVTGTGDIVANAIQPNGASCASYWIDSGQGTTTGNEGQYGQAYRGVDGAVWAAFSPPSSSSSSSSSSSTFGLTPWQEIGPVSGSFAMSSTGTGYLYAGQEDFANGRVLVVAVIPRSCADNTYIVTQQQTSINTAIIREVALTFGANPSYPTFTAQPCDPTTFISLASIDHSKDVTVYSIDLSGPLFTGQVFVMRPGSKNVAVGGDSARYRAVVASVISSTLCTVTITYYANTTTTMDHSETVTLTAYNDTGATLTVSQNVIVDLMNHLNSLTTRWRISEYSC